MQNANTFACRNRPRVDRNNEFACVYLRLRACVCEYCSRSTACAYVYRSGLGMALLALIIYTRVRVVRPFVCANCVRVYTIERAFLRLFTRKNANAVSYVRMRAFVCVRLRACLSSDLIKTQNTFARKIFQHSNALWVQKLSGCTIYS